MKNAWRVSFIVISFLGVLCPFAARGKTFTLSNDALMVLDYKYVSSVGDDANVVLARDFSALGVQFDIHFPDPNKSHGRGPALYWTSSVYGGDGELAGHDINKFDTFALKFTYLYAAGDSSTNATGPVVVSALINPDNKSAGYAFAPEAVDMHNQSYPATTTSVAKTDANQINLVGFACYIPYWWYKNSYNPWDPNGARVYILVEPAPNAVVIHPRLVLNKCTVAAGVTEINDSISFSGKIDSAAKNFVDANVAGAEVKVSLDSNDFNTIAWTFPVDANTYGRGNYKCSKTQNASKTSLAVNTKASTFSFSAKNVDLTGLTCPLTLRIKIGDFNFKAAADEPIVNGPKKLIPLNLLMGVKNVLRVGQAPDKFQAKRGKKPNTDRFSVKGGFAVKNADVNMAEVPLDVNLAGLISTIPARSLKAKKYGFSCSNVKLTDGSIASADFNFNTCVFTLSIKNTAIAAGAGSADLRLQFTGFDENVNVTLP